jgi:cytochrome c553
MRKKVLAATAFAVMSLPALGAEDPPTWAFPFNPPDFKTAADDGVPRHVPGSTASYPWSQLSNIRVFAAPDWHPDDHPPLPHIVARGRAPDVFPCGYCHRAEGTGGPENASLAGLPAAYIVQQMADYRSGARTTSVAKRAPQALMISLSKEVSDAEVQSAAAYFSSLRPRPNIRVVETSEVPGTFVAGWFLAALKGAGKEPIGQRVIEVPEDLEQFELRDSRARFIAYVPMGSVAKGEALVKTGGAGKTVRCATCHGAGLRGLGAVPPIVGRSPTYVVRQLFDFQSGARAGPASHLMKDTVARLSVEDMVGISAYLASLTVE